MERPNNNERNMNSIKQNLKLDFNMGKKNGLNLNATVLSSPDLKKLKVNTPDLERIFFDNGISMSTPTPSTTGNPLFPRTVTEEQESFATGFVTALNNLHNNSNSNQASENSSSTVYTDLEQTNLSFMPIVKEEPQTVPNVSGNTPPMSPVDMEFQERMKLERKRQRNRLAASKCRTRKLERISKLEDKVKMLKNENVDLGTVVNQLKERVGLLKVEVMNHVNAGCPIIQ